MYTSTEHILQCNRSEPLADASGRIVDLINENAMKKHQALSVCFVSYIKFLAICIYSSKRILGEYM